MPRKAKFNSIVVNGVYDGTLADFGNPDKLQSYVVEVEELERVIRTSKGRTLFVSVRQNPRVRDQSDAATGSILTYKAYGHVTVSKRQALAFLKSAYDHKLREISLAHMSISSTYLFIG